MDSLNRSKARLKTLWLYVVNDSMYDFFGAFGCMWGTDRLFCDLHGNELLYHKPKGAVTEGSAGYDAKPAGSVDMSKVRHAWKIMSGH